MHPENWELIDGYYMARNHMIRTVKKYKKNTNQTNCNWRSLTIGRVLRMPKFITGYKQNIEIRYQLYATSSKIYYDLNVYYYVTILYYSYGTKQYFLGI